MSKLAAVAERIAQTKRWLDEEADRLAARLDMLERDAPAIIRSAHRVLDEQLRELDATAQLIQEWLNPLDLADARIKREPAGAGAVGGTQSRQPVGNAPGSLESVHRFVNEQHQDLGRIERTLQMLASELPAPQHAGASQPIRPRPKRTNDDVPPPRRQLDEQQKDEAIESVLQTLANKLHVPPSTDGASMARARLKQANDPPAPMESTRRLLDEPQKDGDAVKPAIGRLGTNRAA